LSINWESGCEITKCSFSIVANSVSVSVGVEDKNAKDKVSVAFGNGVLVTMLYVGMAVKVGGNLRYVGVASNKEDNLGFSSRGFPEQDTIIHKLVNNNIGMAFTFPHVKRPAKIFIPNYIIIRVRK